VNDFGIKIEFEIIFRKRAGRPRGSKNKPKRLSAEDEIKIQEKNRELANISSANSRKRKKEKYEQLELENASLKKELQETKSENKSQGKKIQELENELQEKNLEIENLKVQCQNGLLM